MRRDHETVHSPVRASEGCLFVVVWDGTSQSALNPRGYLGVEAHDVKPAPVKQLHQATSPYMRAVMADFTRFLAQHGPLTLDGMRALTGLSVRTLGDRLSILRQQGRLHQQPLVPTVNGGAGGKGRIPILYSLT